MTTKPRIELSPQTLDKVRRLQAGGAKLPAIAVRLFFEDDLTVSASTLARRLRESAKPKVVEQ